MRRVSLASLVLALLLSAAWAPACLAAEAEALSATLGVRAPTGKQVSPGLIGSNIHVGYERDVDRAPKRNQFTRLSGTNMTLNPELLGRIKELQLHALRFPGGNLSDHFHWYTAVGPLQKRLTNKDEYGLTFKNYFGPLELDKVAKATGAEMIITANYLSGSPLEAANLVEFCNGAAPAPQTGWTEKTFFGGGTAPAGYFAWLRSVYGTPEPMGVKYWEVGNEIDFRKDKHYLKKAADFSKAMKAKDPSIKVGIAADTFQYMNEKEMRDVAMPPGAFDFLVLHYYGNIRTLLPMTNFYSNAESSRTFNAPADGTYTFAVEARGDRALDWPSMQLVVNGTPLRDISVSDKKLAVYTATGPLRKVQNTLAIKYTNDAVPPGAGDRNLYVKTVKITGPDNRPMEVWNTQELEYAWLFANNRLIEEHIGLVQSVFPHMPIAVTEGNAGYGIIAGNADADESRKLKAALWMAGLMNSMIRKNVPIFTQWLLNGNYMGYPLILQDGHVAPSFYTFKMYAVHANRQRVDLQLASPTFDTPLLETTHFGKETKGTPYLDAVASFDPASRELAVTIINRHHKSPISTAIALSRFRLAVSAATIEVLNAQGPEGMEASNEKNPNNVAIRTKTVKLSDVDNLQLTLEPHSVTTVRCIVNTNSTH